MGWFTKLFGQSGKVRYEGMTIDNVPFKGTMEIEIFNISNKELVEQMKNKIYVETGYKVKKLDITGFSE